MRRGAVEDTGAVAHALGFGPEVLVVCDPETWAAAGPAVQGSLRAAGLQPRVHRLGHHPVAGPETIAEVTAVLGAAPSLVAVGSGTINDIVKSTADAAGLPYLAVGTALSMNGYTSAISALLEGGVKRTVRVRPPRAVLIDLDVCAAAPLTMTLSGLGDMLSKPFSEADWRLAYRVDGGYHCERPGGILTESFARMLDAAAGIGRAEPEALSSLADAILLSGISMAMAGVSSPASGGEHLISHYWDMICYGRGKHPFALHGTQVGVACCVIEPLHHRVQGLRGAALDVDACLQGWAPTRDALFARVRARHPRLPADVVERLCVESVKKWRPPDEQRARLARLAGELDDTLDYVGQALLAPGAIRAALERAEAPTAPSQVSPELAAGFQAWGHVRDMRARYTIWDLASEVGLVKAKEAE